MNKLKEYLTAGMIIGRDFMTLRLGVFIRRIRWRRSILGYHRMRMWGIIPSYILILMGGIES